jgi:hypothetical protein
LIIKERADGRLPDGNERAIRETGIYLCVWLTFVVLCTMCGKVSAATLLGPCSALPAKVSLSLQYQIASSLPFPYRRFVLSRYFVGESTGKRSATKFFFLPWQLYSNEQPPLNLRLFFFTFFFLFLPQRTAVSCRVVKGDARVQLYFFFFWSALLFKVREEKKTFWVSKLKKKKMKQIAKSFFFFYLTRCRTVTFNQQVERHKQIPHLKVVVVVLCIWEQ